MLTIEQMGQIVAQDFWQGGAHEYRLREGHGKFNHTCIKPFYKDAS